MKTPEEFLREKYKLVDLANLSINAKPWIELMQEYADANYLSKDKVMEMIFALEKYNQLLSDECYGLVGIAAVHGWKSDRVKDGIKCREEIANLKKQYGL